MANFLAYYRTNSKVSVKSFFGQIPWVIPFIFCQNSFCRLPFGWLSQHLWADYHSWKEFSYTFFLGWKVDRNFHFIECFWWKVYDNEYSSIIDIYFYETFSTQTSSACTLSYHLDTLSDVLDKCLRFSLIKIGSISIFPNQATLGSLLLSVVYTFRLKMLLLVLIKNCNLFAYLIWILSNKLDLNEETRFTIKVFFPLKWAHWKHFW